MRRAAIVALVPLLLLTLAPVVWVFARSFDIAELVARPASADQAPEGAQAGKLLGVAKTPAGTVATVDLNAERTVRVLSYQLQDLSLRPGETVKFRVRRDETGILWREPPEGEKKVGIRTGRVVGFGAPLDDRTPVTIDET